MPAKTETCCDTTATFTMNGALDHSSIDGICLYDAASKKDVCNANGNSGTLCLVNSQPCKFTPEFVRNVVPLQVQYLQSFITLSLAFPFFYSNSFQFVFTYLSWYNSVKSSCFIIDPLYKRTE